MGEHNAGSVGVVGSNPIISTFQLIVQLWKEIKKSSENFQEKEPILKEYLIKSVSAHDSLAESLSYILSHSINSDLEIRSEIQQRMKKILGKKAILNQVICDLYAFRERDPACRNYLSVLLFYKGFQALEIYRVFHRLWQDREMMLALYLQSLTCKTYAIDIHPAARIEEGVFIDHGNSIVIGETTVIGKGTSILQDVTLGGTGKDRGNRHPKVGKGVLIGAGAKVMGNIKIGDYAKIGATSVVLKDIPPYSVAVGVPAQIVGKGKSKSVAQNMDHSLDDC